MASDASSPTLNIRSVARDMDLTNRDGVLIFAEALVASNLLKLPAAMERPIVKRSDPGDVHACDLPLREIHGGTVLAQFCDIILGQPDFDLDYVARVWVEFVFTWQDRNFLLRRLCIQQGQQSLLFGTLRFLLCRSD